VAAGGAENCFNSTEGIDGLCIDSTYNRIYVDPDAWCVILSCFILHELSDETGTIKQTSPDHQSTLQLEHFG